MLTDLVPGTFQFLFEITFLIKGNVTIPVRGDLNMAAVGHLAELFPCTEGSRTVLPVTLVVGISESYGGIEIATFQDISGRDGQKGTEIVAFQEGIDTVVKVVISVIERQGDTGPMERYLFSGEHDGIAGFDP
jgi:hypothetical protein